MASNEFLVTFLLMMLLSSVTTTQIPARDHNQDLLAATDEMQKANYFTFVMLINMFPPDTRLQRNVTFFMPNDRMLANMVMQEGSVSGFLLRHSIPSSLLFGTLEKFPTGTNIPSSLPNYILSISNNGRKNFVLNNVKIVSPNICVAGSSIRCHGIDGILSEAYISVNNASVPPPPCPNGTDPLCRASPSIPSPLFLSSPPRSEDNLSPSTLIAPSPTEANAGPQKSGTSHWQSYDQSLKFVACLMLSLTWIYF